MCTKLGLYIHIPFCKRKCFYCDFVSVEYKDDLSKKYITSLLKEARYYQQEQINTVYIGGGTPSVLTSELLENLILSIKSNYLQECLAFYVFTNCHYSSRKYK